MPRGSRPGERRGGRQPGTPNKKTLLKLAGIEAAGDDASPLDFLLRLMRNPDAGLAERLDAAASAAPFVHSQPKATPPDQTSIVRIDEAGPGGFGEGAVAAFVRAVRKAEGGAARPAAQTVSELTPLEFMLRMVRDEGTPVALRIKAVKASARYVHRRRAAEAPAWLSDARTVLDDRFGFNISPELAVQFRDARPNMSYFGMYGDSGWFFAFQRDMPKARAAAASVQLPDDFKFEDYRSHEGLLKDISQARWQKGGLTEAEEFAEAHLLGRKLIYNSARWKARTRLDELKKEFEQRPDTALEQQIAEIDGRFPDPLMEHPLWETMKALRQKHPLSVKTMKGSREESAK
jgi:hypothetical protein